MVNLKCDKNDITYEVDGSGIEILAELSAAVMHIIDDMSKEDKEISSGLIELFCNGMIGVHKDIIKGVDNDKDGIYKKIY